MFVTLNVTKQEKQRKKKNRKANLPTAFVNVHCLFFLSGLPVFKIDESITLIKSTITLIANYFDEQLKVQYVATDHLPNSKRGSILRE